MLTPVGRLAQGTEFTTTLTDRRGVVLEHETNLGSVLIVLERDGPGEEKYVHPGVLVEPVAPI